MTNKEPYKRILEKRNEMFPPVLEFGCEILNPYTKVSYDKPNIFISKRGNNLTAFRPSFNEMGKFDWKSKHIADGSEQEWQILGKPVALQEIFLMIGEENDIIIDFSEGRHLFIKPHFGVGFYYDLTKSVQDQSIETLEAILKTLE